MVQIRPAHFSEKKEIFQLLWDLETRYPNGLCWLEKKFSDYQQGKARISFAEANGCIAGISIETPKGKNNCKLSTIKVSERFRKEGIGKKLIFNLRNRWLLNSLNKVWVTVNWNDWETRKFLRLYGGFQEITVKKGLYKPEEKEVILFWGPKFSESKF